MISRISNSLFLKCLPAIAVLGVSAMQAHAQEAPKAPAPLGVIAEADPDTNYEYVASYVIKLLESQHYDHKAFDKDVVQNSVRQYLENLDPQKLYFTQTEIDAFMAQYGTTLDDFLLTPDLTPAIDIFLRYRQKVNNRFAKIEKFVTEGKVDMETTGVLPLNRRKLDYAKSEEELDAAWNDRITSDLLEQNLAARLAEEKKAEKAEKAAKKAKETQGAPSEKPAVEAKPDMAVKEKTPQEKVIQRYRNLAKLVNEQDKEDITNSILTAVSQCYDPHSEYMGAPEEDRFRLDMQKSLIGIGAQLQMDMDDNLPTIDKLVRGGPAMQGGQLKPKDKILAVGQGEDGELEETVGLKLDRVVQKIRGQSGTKVRLKVQPAADRSTSKEIIITRDLVPMNETKAKAQLVEHTAKDGTTRRLGWFIIDSFYADMMKQDEGVTRDVIPILQRLIREKIDGLVIDLRGNGGGSLEEALKLTGLFVDRGPVVQVKSFNGNIISRPTKGNGKMYNGPLVVMTDRTSASASEIFAAAMQDYGRGVVVGDKSTFGKGSVQTIIDLQNVIPPRHKFPRAGSLKVTIQKFYRIAGGSTQLKGVTPDIILPSKWDGLEIGEETLDYPMPYDEIRMENYKPSEHSPLPMRPLTDLSKQRIAKDPEFAYILEDVARLKKQTDENSLSLNLEKRISEIKENKARYNQRKKERRERNEATIKNGDPFKVYEINVENVKNEQLQLVEDVKKETFMVGADDEEEDDEPIDDFLHDLDPLKLEGLAVLEDLIGQKAEEGPKTAQADSANQPK
jgi:carboxyl-terminal processing protease